MTGSNGVNIQSNSKHGNGQHRGWEICAINMNNIYKSFNYEPGRDSTVYIYTNSAYSNRVWYEFIDTDSSDIFRG